MPNDMADRLSFLSTGGSLNGDSTNTNGGYMNVKTPLADDGAPSGRFEGGALREGGAPDLLSREMIGLLSQYAAVGLIYGSLPGTIYPFLTNYLNVEPNQSVAAKTLVLIPWSFKVFYGFLTDCFPIYGLRRRPYMLLGWSLCIAMLFIMGFTQIGDPYYPDPALAEIEEAKMTPEQRLSLNKDAQNAGSKYVVLMMFSSVGYLMADVTADALTVEYAQREPEDIRGRTQTAIYAVRTIFMVVANLLAAFTFNGKDYGGDFAWSLSFPSYMLLLAVVMCPVLPMTWALIKEQRCESPGFDNYIREFWAVLQTRAVYQIIAYKFFGGLFENFSYVAADQIQSKWVRVTPLNDKMAIIFSYAITAGGMVVAGRYGLHWNWRVITASTMIIMVAIDAICTLFVTWDIIRSQFFYLSLPTIEFFPYSIGFIVSTFVVVEIAEMGHEGAIYGLLTTVSNLSDPFAKTLTKNVNQPFDITVDAIIKDDTEIRTKVTITLLIMYTMKLLSLAWLPLLPPQKKATQMLKAHGGTSRAMGLFTVMYISFAMIWSVTTNLMSMFASTQCLAISGGSGCASKNTKDAKTNS